MGTESKTNIPAPLFKILLLILGATLSLLIISLAVLFIGRNKMIPIIGIIVSIGIAVYGFVLWKKFREKKYTTIDGLCTDSELKGILNHKTWQVTIEDVGSKDLYSFTVSAKNRHRILPGDRLYLYMPEDSMVVENNGILDIFNYYGFEIHR